MHKRQRTHGLISTYKTGCRCPDCTAANLRDKADSTKRRSARLAADPTLAPHGSASTYGNWGCRCDPCRIAHSERVQEYRASVRKKGAR